MYYNFASLLPRGNNIFANFRLLHSEVQNSVRFIDTRGLIKPQLACDKITLNGVQSCKMAYTKIVLIE